MDSTPDTFKSRILRMINDTVYKYWVDPLQNRLAERETDQSGQLAKSKPAVTLWLLNLGRLVITRGQVKIIHLKGSDWSIAYIGTEISLEFIKAILFSSTAETPVEAEVVRKGFVWQVPGLIEQLTSQYDMVLYEQNLNAHWMPRCEYVFSTPHWVRQVLDISRPIEEIQANMTQNMRRNLKKMIANGFSYVHTTDPADFDMFYYDMHIPYVTYRHDMAAEVGDYEAVRNVFASGGLILIKRDEQAICGMIGNAKGNLYTGHQMGVHKDHFDQVAEGSNVALWWFMMDWAKGLNLHYFDFGASYPTTGNGVFNFKRQWGTKATPGIDPVTRWVFAAKQLSPDLRQFLNECGFIGEVDGGLYQVIIPDPSETFGAEQAKSALTNAAKYGLDGVMLVASSNQKILPIEN